MNQSFSILNVRDKCKKKKDRVRESSNESINRGREPRDERFFVIWG
jgi:hypothetical protein